MRDTVIISAVRTPIAKFQGALEGFSAPQLGAIAVREAVKRSASWAWWSRQGWVRIRRARRR